MTVLEIGALADTVTVTSQGATVQTASSERGEVITASQVENIPVRGRNAWDLMQLMPGTVPAAATNESISRNTRMNVNGGRINTISVVVDGMGMNQIGNFANELLNVSMDAVEEVKVLMSNYQAEYGRTSGAEVQMATKSGKRDFHGLFSYFKRHEEFNANSFFNNRNGLPKGRYRFNTFNYNIGGPIYIPGKFNTERNKLFFFFSQEFWPVTTTASGRLTVPTALERAGNFSQSVDLNNALIPIVDPTTRQPVPGNIIPANRLDSNGLALLKVLPLPNFSNRQISGGNYNYVFNAETSTPQRFGTMRIDYNINARNQVYGTYSFYLDRQTGWQVATTSSNWNQLPRTFWTNPKLVVLRYNFIATPTLVNELTVGGNGRREAEDIVPDALAQNLRSKIGFTAGQFNPGVNPSGFIPNATFGGVPNAANLSMDARTPINDTRLNIPLSDNITKIYRGHVIKAGFLAERIFSTGDAATPFNGSYAFARDVNNPLDSGLRLQQRRLRRVQLLYRTVEAQHEYIVVHLRRRLRAGHLESEPPPDAGLRFALLPSGRRSPERRRGIGIQPGLLGPFESREAGAARHRRRKESRSRSGYPGRLSGDGGRRARTQLGRPGQRHCDSGAQQVVPERADRHARAAGSSALRLCLGSVWRRQDRDSRRGRHFQRTQRQRLGRTQPAGAHYHHAHRLLRHAGHAAVVHGVHVPSTITTAKRDSKSPYAMNASLSVQRNIGFGTVVDVAYVGTFGRHLEWTRDLNAIPLGANFNPKNADPTNAAVPLPASFLRGYTGFNNINQADWAANSSYHSLQVTANRRFAHGLQFGGAWTWSKAMGYVDADGTAITSLVSAKIWNYGPAGFDRTHVLKLELPVGRARRAAEDRHRQVRAAGMAGVRHHQFRHRRAARCRVQPGDQQRHYGNPGPGCSHCRDG